MKILLTNIPYSDKVQENNKDTALKGKSNGKMKFRELPAGARQYGVSCEDHL